MSAKLLLIVALGALLVAAITVAVINSTQDENNTPEAIADEEGVVTTASGLKYLDLKVGEGKEAKEGSTVLVIYAGKLPNGVFFDSNTGKDPYPVTIGKTSVIRGWTEGLQGMRAGGKRKLIIPPGLAYGKEGRMPKIPPDATLVFEVEITALK